MLKIQYYLRQKNTVQYEHGPMTIQSMPVIHQQTKHLTFRLVKTSPVISYWLIDWLIEWTSEELLTFIGPLIRLKCTHFITVIYLSNNFKVINIRIFLQIGSPYLGALRRHSYIFAMSNIIANREYFLFLFTFFLTLHVNKHYFE